MIDKTLSSASTAVGGFAGSITTEGEFSRGLFAQSVGGGGGTGGLSVAAAGALGAVGAVTGTASVGGQGGAGGDGGAVNVKTSGSITTRSGRAVALLVQSVGGGGGDGGASIAGSAAGGGVASLSANVGSGGEGGNAGDGGAVQLIAGPGTIRTEGKIDNKVTGETDGQSPGIIAQSVGGGGGNGGFAIAGGASVSEELLVG